MTGAFYFQGATDMPGCTSRLLPKALLLPNGICIDHSLAGYYPIPMGVIG